MANKSYKNQFINRVLQAFVLGFSAFLLFIVISTSTKTTLADVVASKKLVIYNKENVLPAEILIPKLSLRLPVKGADIKDGTWVTYKDVASFGLGSAHLTDTAGSTVIFAHAKSYLFSHLDELIAGDAIYVYGDGLWYKFDVSHKLYVSPTDISFLVKDYGRSLILFTCYGFDDEQRVVVIAKFTKLVSNSDIF